MGIILYEMLTGRVPFEGDTPFTVAVKQKSEIPKDPTELNAQIPGALSRLILRCLEKDKETRYQSAGELRADLEKIENGASTSERPVAKRKTVASKPITVTITRKKLLIPALAVALIAIAAVIWFVVLKKAAPLLPEQKRSIAVISFENQTGDKNYDYLSRAIPDILITRLEQSGLMSVTTWDRLQDLLKQAKKPDVQFINKDLGLELCRLDGAEVLAQGSFIKTGEMFAINVRLYDVAANRLLKTASSSGQGETSILKTQIDELSKAIAKGAGVSSRQLATDTAKAAEMMTSSPEAYKWFLMGREEFYRLNFPTALRYLEKAAEIDPDLAMAQRFLSLTYRNLGRSAESRQALEKAYKLSGKIGEKDRLLIESDYAGSVENDRPKRLKILEDLVKKYPKERTIYLELGETLFFEKGEYDKAISLFDKALALFPDDSYTMNTMSGPLAAIGRPDLAIERLKSFLARVPDDANNYDTLGLMYILSGDLDQAIASFNDALAIRPDLLGSVERSVYPFALKEDYQEVLSRLDRIIGVIQVPLDQFRACLYKAFFLFWLGSPTKALAALDAADKLADEFKLPTNYRLYVPFLRSWLDLEGGEIEKGRQEAEKMREIDRTELGNNPSLEAQWKAQGELGLAFAELKAGRLESAKNEAGIGQDHSGKNRIAFL